MADETNDTVDLTGAYNTGATPETSQASPQLAPGATVDLTGHYNVDTKHKTGTLADLANDKEFMAKSPADQQRHLESVSPDFAKSSSEEKAAMLASLTKKPTEAKPQGFVDTYLKTPWNYWSKGGPLTSPSAMKTRPAEMQAAPERPTLAPDQIPQGAQGAADLSGQTPIDYSDPTGGGTSELGASKIRQRSSEMGSKAASAWARGQMASPVTGFEQGVPTDVVSQEKFEKEAPVPAGIIKSAGGTIGSILGDPAMYPLFALPGNAAVPTILKYLITLGFAGQMTDATVEGAKELGAAWDTMTREQKTKAIADLATSTLFAATTGAHAVEGAPEALREGTKAVGAGLEQAKDFLPSKETVTAPVRFASRVATKLQPILPTAIGIGAGEAIGHPWLGAAAGRFGLRPEVLDPILERGRTFGQPKEVADYEELKRDQAEAIAKQQTAQREYDKHNAGQERGVPAPDPVLKAKEKADAHLALITEHLNAAREKMEAYRASEKAGPDQPIALSPEQEAAQAARETPTDEQLKARQEALMGKIEEKVGIGKPERLQLGAGEPEVPAEKAEVPPVMTAGKPEGRPTMRGLKVVDGKVVDTTAGPETEAGKALGTERGARMVPATEGVAVKRGIRVPDENEIAAAQGEAERKEVHEEHRAETAEELARRQRKEEETKASKAVELTEPHEKELANEGRSPEDESKVKKIVSELPNQDLLRTMTKHGLDESQYDLSKREPLREGGSKHPVDRIRAINDLKLPETLKDHIVDAEVDWDKKNPQTFDAPARSSKFWADRARAIMKDATERWEAGNQKNMSPEERNKVQAELAKEGAGGGHDGALPIPENEEDFKKAVDNPFKIIGQPEAKAEGVPEAKGVPEPKVNPPVGPVPDIDRTKVAGGGVSQPYGNYHEAAHKAEGNAWVRDPSAPESNEGRTVMLQIDSNFLNRENMNDPSKAYYDKLYSGAREGYARMSHFWEPPQWMGWLANSIPDADMYVINDIEEAKDFLKNSGYSHVTASVLDVNKAIYQELAESMKAHGGTLDAGGYVKPTDMPDNVRWHDSPEAYAKSRGIEYKPGVDYRHFVGSDSIPRLTLSDGCPHACPYCTVPKKITEVPRDVIFQQVDAIAKIGAKFTYLNDKTFGAAKNNGMVLDGTLYERMKQQNPNFQGFIVQTTPDMMSRFSVEDLKKSGIKYVELGIESYNKSVWDKMAKDNGVSPSLFKHKSEAAVTRAFDRARQAGVAVIPNIMIGLPGETAETYAHSLQMFEDNNDVISHGNIYNWAIYKDSKYAQSLNLGTDGADLNENVLNVNRYENPQLHTTFSGQMYDLGKELLNRKVGEPMTERGKEIIRNAPAELKAAENVPEKGAEAEPKGVPGQEAGPKGFPDYKEVADTHNKDNGFTYNMKKGFIKGEPVFSVGVYPGLEKAVPHIIKPEDIKGYVEDPKVKAALEEHEDNSVGHWRYKGKSHLDVSRLYTDLGDAIQAGKDHDQNSIHDHENGRDIPIGGHAADKAQAKAAAETVGTKEGAISEVAEKFATPEEKAGIAKSPAQTAKFVQTMEKIPEVQEYVDIALAGSGARKWYQRSAKAFEAMSEEAPEYFKEEGDKDKFINLLAASSPRQSVAMNLRETLRTWKEYVDAGRPTGDALKTLLDKNLTPAASKTPNAIKALTGQEMWPDITKNKNFKVPSFARNLRGWLDSVTNDGWMSLFAGLDPREISSAHSYHPLSIATRAAADELGWEPAEAQAAIWSFTQALTERGEELPEEVRKHSEDFVDLLAHDPQVRSLLADLGVTHANLDAKLRAIGEKPEVSSRTSPTTGRSIERLKERIEKARGRGTIPPPKSAQGTFEFREAPAQGNRARVKDEDVEFNPEQITKNASGESEASQEALKRAASEKRQGVKYYVQDSRSGNERPLLGMGAVDYKVQPYEHLIRRGPDGETIMDSGAKAGMLRKKR